MILLMRIRQPLIEYFSTHHSPISAKELLTVYPVNKTTVYRELEFLKSKNIIHEVVFADGVKRYEFSNQTHHHHLVCVKCDSVADVEIDENLQDQEKQILKSNRFKVINHSLEFFGLCQSCV